MNEEAKNLQKEYRKNITLREASLKLKQFNEKVPLNEEHINLLEEMGNYFLFNFV